jgi:D-alanyl-D-alanine carboxypeptidase (penicillin-binding protein 5/6)
VVSQYSSSMIGTSANLNHKDIVNIYQLFHALMLPSGNDAAVVLAENFVSLLRFRDFLFT